MAAGRGLLDGDGGRAEDAAGGEKPDGRGRAEGGDDQEDGAAWSDEAAEAALERQQAGEGRRKLPGVLDAPVKRGPGRPKGAANRKSEDFGRWYRAMGFKDPLRFMGEVISRDAVALQAWYIDNERAVRAQGKHHYLAIPSLKEIEDMQLTAAERLAPYLHGKMPVEVVVTDERLPQLLIDLGSHQLAEAATIAGRKALAAGAPMIEADASKINDLDISENGNVSHEGWQAIENKGVTRRETDD